ncbi:MAG: F510_1955 family glycosylhydrolase [Dehalococcoidia bacterium]
MINRLFALAVLAIGVSLALAGCGQDDGAPSGAPAATSALAQLGDDPGVLHVHGLGVDGRDGSLYAATHTGLFRITSESRAERVGAFQDLMGFTVQAPGVFLASGHPSPQMMRDEKLPPHLGLLRSTDGGEAWERLSLLGEADFHVLRIAKPAGIYGYNSVRGELLYSQDGKQWQTRSRPQVFDFVVSPEDPELLLATTATGLARSVDGGRSWTAVEGPPLAFLAWETAGAVYGVAPDGRVYRNSDGGLAWEERSRLTGKPEAMLVHGDQLLVAVDGRGIVESLDGGATWTDRYRLP